MTASRSASKTTSVTSPTSSPSSCSGIGRVAAHLDAVAVVQHGASGSRVRPVSEVTHRARQASRARSDRGASRSRPPSIRAPRGRRSGSAADVAVRIGVRDERERGAAVADDLERRVEAHPVLRERPHRRPGEDRVARPLAVLVAAARIHPADQLGVEPDSRRRTRSGGRWRGRARSCASGRPRSPARPRAARAAGPARAAARSCRRPGRSRARSRAARRSAPR